MKSFLILTALVAFVAADVSHLVGKHGDGYHYNVPHTSYGVPTQNVAESTGFNTGYTSNYKAAASQAATFVPQASASASYTPSNTGNHYQQGAGSYQNTYQTGSSQSTYQYPQQAASSGNVYSPYKFAQRYQTGQQYQTTHQYQTGQNFAAGEQQQQSYVPQYQYQYQQQQQPAQVFKHFYVHAAPEEPEQPKFRQPAVLPPPQKHYKIIFIKTPAQAAAAPQYVPVQQQNEEKTIVYVLVQKPEDMAQVVIPKIEQKPPTKPEVFFIKYNGKEGSESVINNIVNDYSKEQGSVQVSGSGLSTGSSETSVNSGSFAQQSGGLTQVQTVATSGDNSQYNSGLIEAARAIAGHGSSSQAEASFQQVVDTVSQTQYSGDVKPSQGSYSTATVSTSQGVPHESYGPPTFRP